MRVRLCTGQSIAALCLVLGAGFAVSACSGGSSPPAIRLAGARRVALAVPADWKTEVGGCPATPRTVDFLVPLKSGQSPGECVTQAGGSLPAYDTVAVYIMAASDLSRRRSCCSGEFRLPHSPPSGTVHGMPYYIFDSKESGALGVGAVTLDVPQIGVAFLVGARDHDAASSLLATVRFVSAGTRLR
jgi:hypothetical protein